jgi:molybdopterin/thiamine biosynthesis adenylyltransferase
MMSPTDRQERIRWWRQEVIRDARVAVIGAGALGNEVLKNLALLGVGEIHIFDFDTVEISNLSRTVLFRSGDVGRKRAKAEVAAERLRELHIAPQAAIAGHSLDVVWDLGGGFFRRVDCVLGCLDNLEARLAVARHCYQFGTPFIDGGIRELDGRVQLHRTGSGACFDCMIGEGERSQLEARYSCEKVMKSHVESGLVPTVQVTSALVAALMCQEAVRCLHGMPVRFGSMMTWYGGSLDFDCLEMQRWPGCFTCSVAPMARVQNLPLGPRHTGRDLVESLPAGWRVILPSPFLRAVRCGEGGHAIPIGKPSHRCVERELVCPEHAGDLLTEMEKDERLCMTTPREVLERSLQDLGIPAEAALFGECGTESALFVLNEA